MVLRGVSGKLYMDLLFTAVKGKNGIAKPRNSAATTQNLQISSKNLQCHMPDTYCSVHLSGCALLVAGPRKISDDFWASPKPFFSRKTSHKQDCAKLQPPGCMPRRSPEPLKGQQLKW